MALSDLQPADQARSFSALPEQDFSLMASIGNTPLVDDSTC